MSVDVIVDEFILQDQLILNSEAVDTLFLEARTANAFTDEPVTEEQMRAIYELTKMGPTAMNIQPMRITWVKSETARATLVSHMAGGNAAKTAAAPMAAILSFDTHWHEHLPALFPHAAERKAAFDDNEAARLSMGNDNGHLQAAYFIMAARTVGLAAGPMAGFNTLGVDADFHGGTTNQTFMVINLGKPGENAWHDRRPRLDYEVATTTV
ncbi:malonic semialdehyde reductase [Arthrobacter roseus]|uniref:malonic semialdehyde reductase n=1 Tax=Arthrobacter roseus TaxID=136274 RepID=UPI001962683C|nr:malonic semialdehyde reductase [Arthrobacter roseus]MBM7847261.1 nitroreductase [Arthrobacter roseus]